MEVFVSRLTGYVLIILLLAMVFFMLVSWFEKGKRAVKRVLAVIFVLLLLLLLQFSGFIPPWFQYFFLSGAVFFSVFVWVSFGNRNVVYDIPTNRFDERDIMFSRMELKEGSKRFDDYYRNKPEKKVLDDLFRAEPGLLNPAAAFYHTFYFKKAEQAFKTIQNLQPLVEAECYETKQSVDPNLISKLLKKQAKKLGAADVGFTTVMPHHLYSYIGRGAKYGEKVDLNHKYALAFTVEMDYNAMRFNPKGPVIAESARQYLNAGSIAVHLAQIIRELGYDARAHIDANYRVICPLVARDAGLGEIGRMGLLMTRRLGPRVRIGVVTTNLELIVDHVKQDSSMIHFCELCKKCAVNCPSGSISREPLLDREKYLHRPINHESCFTYWCKVGTDCGRCMAVCPYSHPNNFLHNFIRILICRNPVNRKILLWLDNWFYGKKPSLINPEH